MVDAVQYTTYLWSLSFMHGEFVFNINIRQYKNTDNKNTDNKIRNIDLRSAGHVRGDWSKERNMDQ